MHYKYTYSLVFKVLFTTQINDQKSDKSYCYEKIIGAG